MFFAMGCRRRSNSRLISMLLRKASQRYLATSAISRPGGWRHQIGAYAAGVCISGSVALATPILLVDDPLAADERMATLELGYLPI